MNQNFTPDQILQYIYKEDSPGDRYEIRQALQNDDLLREVGRQMARATHLLPKVTFRPRAAVIDRILAYSRRAEVSREA